MTDQNFSFSTNALVSEGLISWILQFGKDIEVVSPPELRQMVINRITDLRELYK